MVVVVTAIFLAFGFVLTRSAPSEIRRIIWIILAGLTFPLLLAGLWLRRRIWRSRAPVARSSSLVRLRTRLMAYLLAAVVTAVSTEEQARVLLAKRPSTANTMDILLWNFAGLAVLIAVLEVIEWRRRRSGAAFRPY